jgi:integrase/recombinase XerD
MATDFAVSLRRFLTDHMAGLRGCSPNTISSYRDTFKLLICYLRDERSILPERLTLDLIDVDMITAFIAWLRADRRNSPSTCNQRLAAISSFFSWLQTQDPARMACCQDIIQIPSSKHDQPAIAHLTVEQTRQLLALPDRCTRQGRRDATLLATLYDTAARVQELADLTVRDIRLQDPAIVALTGKGRKTRHVPIDTNTAALLAAYLAERQLDRPRRDDRPVFFNSSTNTTRNSAAAGSPGSSTNTRRRQPTPRSLTRSSARTSSDITWTGRLCGRLACSPCWAWRRGRFRPHNVGVVRVGGGPLTP